ncbi:MAG: hypothetical protein HY820_16950 [Acidobacteria bacterium]|nr:hypothetical protein [Acidobacteriota bacterium]
MAPATQDFPAGFRWQPLAINLNNAIVTGLSNDGRIIGTHSLPGDKTGGFVMPSANGTVTSFSPPGQSTAIVPKGINASGKIVGSHSDANGYHGFIRDANGSVSSFDVPGARSTSLFAINDVGQILGGFLDSDGMTRTIQMTSPPAFIQVDSPDNPFVTTSLNNSGTTVQSAVTTAFVGDGATIASSGVVRSGADVGGFFTCRPNSRASIRGAGWLASANDSLDIAGTCSISRYSGIATSTSSYVLLSATGKTLYLGTTSYIGALAPTNEGATLLTGINNLRQFVVAQNGQHYLISACAASPSVTTITAPPSGGTITIPVTSSQPDCVANVFQGSSWIGTTTAFAPNGSSSSVSVDVQPNTTGAARAGTVWVAGTSIPVTQDVAPCSQTVSGGPSNFLGVGGGGSLTVTTPSYCSWAVTSGVSWITIAAGAAGSGNGTITFQVGPNFDSGVRNGAITVGTTQFMVTQSGAVSCSYSVSPPSVQVSALGTTGQLAITTSTNCSWSASSQVSWITLSGSLSGVGNGSVSYTVQPNGAATARAATLSIGAANVAVVQAAGTGLPTGLRFVPLPPCRVMETRTQYNFEGRTGVFGPPSLDTGETRTLNLPVSTVCSIPATAKAYVVNATVIPSSTLSQTPPAKRVA